MIINITPPNIEISINGISITDKVDSLEIARTTLTQGIINLTPGHELDITPGDLILLNLPVVKNLIVQSYFDNQLVVGCYLSTYLDAVPSNPDKQASEYLPKGLTDILHAKGIPLGKISITPAINLGSTPTYGSDPVELANACGFLLYSDNEGIVKLSPMSSPEESVGTFTLEELANNPNIGVSRPLTASKVISTGELTKVKKKDAEYKIESITEVRGGNRTVTKEYKVNRFNIIESETITEPRSQISSFSNTYLTNSSNPNTLLFKFQSTIKSPIVESQKTTVTTSVNRDGYIVRRITKTTGVAAKGLAGFYAAWAAAEIPEPSIEEEEEELEDNIFVDGNSLFTPIYLNSRTNFITIPPNSSFVTGEDYNFSSSAPLQTDPNALTLLRPGASMFDTVNLEIIEENWEWDISENQDTITNINSPRVNFKSTRGKVKYSRVKFLPLGAILPECGDPLFGYQEPTQESRPVYRDPTGLILAEKEIIIYNLDETGQWYADRVLEQAIGVRNAQQPIDAMNSVQYPSDNINAYATDRTFVAINVASQLTLAISERIQSAPPSKPSLQDEIQYDLTRNYRFEIELEDNALLERTIQVSPSSFSPNIKSIIAFSQYQAMAIKGQSMAITVEMPLADLNFDIPSGSIIVIDNKKYSIQQIKVSVNVQSALLQFTLWPF